MLLKFLIFAIATNCDCWNCKWRAKIKKSNASEISNICNCDKLWLLAITIQQMRLKLQMATVCNCDWLQLRYSNCNCLEFSLHQLRQRGKLRWSIRFQVAIANCDCLQFRLSTTNKIIHCDCLFPICTCDKFSAATVWRSPD